MRFRTTGTKIAKEDLSHEDLAALSRKLSGRSWTHGSLVASDRSDQLALANLTATLAVYELLRERLPDPDPDAVGEQE